MNAVLHGAGGNGTAGAQAPGLAPADHRRLSVLVVDDEPLVLRVFQAFLSRRGDDVVLAENADQALARLKERSFDVMVTDLRMPGRNGVELVGLARQLRPEVVSILLTGNATKGDVIEAIRAGVFDYLEKPILDLMILGFAIDRAGEQARLVRERNELLQLQLRQNERLEADLDVLNRAYLRLARQDQALRSDLERAQHMQQSLLPRAFPPVRGLDVAGFYQPCEQLAGDFFDFLPLPGDRLVVYIADVAGHGVRSALVTVVVRQFFHGQRLLSDSEVLGDPTAALAQLNRALVAQPFGEPIHVTMGYAVFDLRTGEVAYSGAGHPKPILVRPGATPLLVSSAGPGLGIEDEPRFESTRVRLGLDDFLLLYTDGLPEALDRDRHEVTVAGAMRWAQQSRSTSAEVVCAELEERLAVHRAGLPPDDDLTYVVARRTDFAQLPLPRSEAVRIGAARAREPVRASQGTAALVGSTGLDRVVRLRGRSCWDRAPALLAFFREAERSGAGAIYLDAAECTSVDSTMLGLFLQQRERFVLVRPSDRVLEQLAELGLTRFLRISDLPPPETGDLQPLPETSQDEPEQVVLSAHEALMLSSMDNRSRFAPTVELMRADLEARQSH